MTVYTIKELTEILKISDKTVRRLLQSGAIRGFRVGSDWRVTEEALMAYIHEQEEKAI